MAPVNLPQVTITAISAGRCQCRVEPSKWIGENRITCLWLGRDKFLWGRFHDVDKSEQTCVFAPDKPEQAGRLLAEKTYPYLDGYWGERAEIALDEKRNWHKVRFEASDAIEFITPNGRLVRKAIATDTGGRLIPSGWDHDHCAILSEKIGRGGLPKGFNSEPDAWVCERCYVDFVKPKSLAFIPSWQLPASDSSPPHTVS
jgi:hypothetical protein